MMLKTLGLALLLLSGAAPSHQSQLVEEEDHIHSWQTIQSDDGEQVWLDGNWRSTVDHEKQSYPVFLIRALVPFDTKPEAVDMTLAIDCSGQKIAVVDAWMKIGLGSKGQMMSMEDLSFRPADEAANDQLFAAVCGTPISQ